MNILRAGFDDEPTITRNRRRKDETKIIVRYRGQSVPIVPDTVRCYPGGTIEINLHDLK